MQVKESMAHHLGEVDTLNKKIAEEIESFGHPTFNTLLEYYDRAYYILEDWEEERDFCFNMTGYAKYWCDQLWRNEDDQYRQLYWTIMKWEAQNRNFDSYMLYLEKNRDPKDRFYEPRRKCFTKIGLVQALQDILDGKLEILSISMPPGTGKLIADDTPVLTTKGWKTHGELVVGDYVYGLDGKPKKVEVVFPKNQADVLITFSNDEQIQCHEEHEWYLHNNKCGMSAIVETRELFNNLTFSNCDGEHSTWFLPLREKISNEHDELLSIVVVNIERVEPKQGNCIQVEGGIYCVGKTCIPTHNSTIEKFFHSALCGWFSDDYNLFYSHSGDITRMYYEGMLDILTNSDEYTWNEIFPNSFVTSTNAKTEQINVDKYKPFKNVQCTSVGAKNAGKVRASKFLLCDDLIGGIEEALNKNTLDKLWNVYSVDARQRKIDGCREIHIATRWSVHDVIGRLQKMYDGDQRCRFIAVPDIDPQTGESNFMFEINGFSAKFFEEQAKVMDDISYRCLYKNEPIEREGLLFTEDSLRRYYSLPSGEPDMIYMQCDHKDKGTDYMIAPVLLKYGDDYYCTDCVCSADPDYEKQYQNLTDLILRNKVQSAEFERNQGGGRVAKEINERVERAGWICHITDKPTESNKEARIFQCAAWIKQHVLFKAKENYAPKSDYGEMMSQLLTYSTSGKNPHDDIPDCFSLFALRITGGNKVAKIEAVYNPFWS